MDTECLDLGVRSYGIYDHWVDLLGITDEECLSFYLSTLFLLYFKNRKLLLPPSLTFIYKSINESTNHQKKNKKQKKKKILPHRPTKTTQPIPGSTRLQYTQYQIKHVGLDASGGSFHCRKYSTEMIISSKRNRVYYLRRRVG